jgi:hypothetical protein
VIFYVKVILTRHSSSHLLRKGRSGGSWFKAPDKKHKSLFKKTTNAKKGWGFGSGGRAFS